MNFNNLFIYIFLFRYFLIQKAKDADTVGIVAGTLGVGKSLYFKFLFFILNFYFLFLCLFLYLYFLLFTFPNFIELTYIF